SGHRQWTSTSDALTQATEIETWPKATKRVTTEDAQSRAGNGCTGLLRQPGWGSTDNSADDPSAGQRKTQPLEHPPRRHFGAWRTVKTTAWRQANRNRGELFRKPTGDFHPGRRPRCRPGQVVSVRITRAGRRALTLKRAWSETSAQENWTLEQS